MGVTGIVVSFAMDLGADHPGLEPLAKAIEPIAGRAELEGAPTS